MTAAAPWRPDCGGRAAGAWESYLIRPDESRSNLAVGLDWASRITTVGLEFVLPPLLGHLLDGRLGSSPVALLVGAVLGFVLGMMHVLRFAREGGPGPKGKTKPGRD